MTGGSLHGKANSWQQVLKTSVVPQVVHVWIQMKIDEPVGVLFTALLQVLNRPVVFPQANIDSRKEIGRNISLLCQLGQILEYLTCLAVLPAAPRV